MEDLSNHDQQNRRMVHFKPIQSSNDLGSAGYSNQFQPTLGCRRERGLTRRLLRQLFSRLGIIEIKF